MAFDERLAQRIRQILKGARGVTEKRMFGGLCFLVRGKMCCGVERDHLVVRVGPEQYERALSKPHARPMDFTGRPLKGFVYGLNGRLSDGCIPQGLAHARPRLRLLAAEQEHIGI